MQRGLIGFLMAIREELGVPEPTKGSRMLYILVFRKLQPITELQNTEFFDVWRQCIMGHITLWKEGVYHQDVSPENMMWYGKDGKRIGILNDYDLSSLPDDLGPRGNKRMGMVPFMALELLTKAGLQGKVKYLHGVLLPVGSRPLDEWVTLNTVACGMQKHYFLGHLRVYYPSDIDDNVGRFLVDCVRVLRQNAERRSSRSEELLLKRGATEQSDDEEPEDVDGFLQVFTTKKSWVKLTELSNPSQ